MKGQSLWDRLWSKVIFPDNLDDCYGWTGARSLKRRGTYRPVIQVGGRGSKIELAYRLVCAWYQGPAPEGCEAGHTCPGGENPMCCNPRHLVWMTRVENERYKQARRDESPLRPTSPSV